MYKIISRWIDDEGMVIFDEDNIVDNEYKIIEQHGFKKVRFNSDLFKQQRTFCLDELGVNWVAIIDIDNNNEYVIFHHNEKEETLEEWKSELSVNIKALQVYNDRDNLKKVAEIAKEIQDNVKKIQRAEYDWQ